MKKGRFLWILLAVTALMLLIPEASGGTPDYIRLHVIANSDGEYDQAVKLGVRDAIREVAAEQLTDCESADEAYVTLDSSVELLKSAATASAREMGYDGPVDVLMGVYEFPDRVYGEELVPAGNYRAVRVVLGEGNGKNWWCVVYPSMCLPEEMDSPDELTFYSSIGRWLSGWLSSGKGGEGA